MENNMSSKRNLVFGFITILLLYLDGFVYYTIGQGLLEGQAHGHLISNLTITLIWAIGAFFLWFYPIFLKKEHKPDNSVLTFIVFIVLLVGINMFAAKSFVPHVIRSFSNYIVRFAPFGVETFIYQQVYYLVEAVLVVMIVYFFQEYGELKYKKKLIPYGAIGLAVFWGLVHIFTKGLATGIQGFILSSLLGVSYVAMNKSCVKLYVLAVLLFMI